MMEYDESNYQDDHDEFVDSVLTFWEEKGPTKWKLFVITQERGKLT